MNGAAVLLLFEGLRELSDDDFGRVNRVWRTPAHAHWDTAIHVGRGSRADWFDRAYNDAYQIAAEQARALGRGDGFPLKAAAQDAAAALVVADLLPVLVFEELTRPLREGIADLWARVLDALPARPQGHGALTSA